MPAADVVVVGGGIAGLVAARELVLAGADVTVLESRDRLGGQVARHSVAGIELDAGAEAFSTRGGTVAELARSLRLDDEIVTPIDAPAWLHRADGTTVPLPATSMLGIPALPLAQDVVDAIGMRAAFRAQLDTILPSFVGSKATTLGELVRRRMGRGVLEGLVAPVVRGVHSTTPDELELVRVAPTMQQLLMREGTLSRAVLALRTSASAGSLVASFRGGMFRLVDALAADLDRFGVRVRTGVEVTDVDAGSVTTADGERITGDVVVASPLGVEAPRTRVRVVTIAVDAPELAAAPRGTGVLVASGAPDVAARAMTHVTAKWPWLADETPLQVLRLSYDGDVEADAARAHRDAEVLVGTALPAPVDAAVVEWERTGRHDGAQHAIDGMRRVGEAESGTGLAAVVAYARSVTSATPPGAPSGAD